MKCVTLYLEAALEYIFEGLQSVSQLTDTMKCGPWLLYLMGVFLFIYLFLSK